MRRWPAILGALVAILVPGILIAQMHTNPSPGDVWTYFGPTLGGGWGAPSGGGTGSPGGTTGQLQWNNAGTFGGVTIGGDFNINTTTGTGTINPNAITTAKINDGAVTNAKLATPAITIAGITFNLGGSVTSAALTAALGPCSTTLQGTVPASGGGTTNFLRADCTWAAPPGGGGGSVSLTAGTPSLVVSPNPITGTGTISTTVPINAPADGGSHSYTILSSDLTKCVELASTFTAVAVPQATGSFASGASFCTINKGAVVATSTTSTIDAIAGATGRKLSANSVTVWVSDGTNWLTQPGMAPGTADGQLMIWNNTTKQWVPATLTAGTNVTITNAAGSITVAAAGGGAGCSTAGSAGQILTDDGAGGCTSNANATLSTGAATLGASGTAGSVTMGNATSGTVKIQPVTGALGTVTASLPANTGTIAELNLAQTWTAKQTMTASGPLEVGANSGNLGSVKLYGNTSGDVTIKPAAAAGTATVFQLPADNGTNTYVLQTNGSGVTSWVAASGGGITCPTGFSVSGANCAWTQTASGSASSIEWTGLVGDDFHLKCWHVTPASGTPQLTVQFGKSTGPTWITANYSAEHFVTQVGVGTLGAGGGTTEVGFYMVDGAELYHFSANFSGLSQAVAHGMDGHGSASLGGSPYMIWTGGQLTSDTAVKTAIRIAYPATNIATGKCTLYAQ